MYGLKPVPFKLTHYQWNSQEDGSEIPSCKGRFDTLSEGACRMSISSPFVVFPVIVVVFFACILIGTSSKADGQESEESTLHSATHPDPM
jgi:hypothetical protein